MHGVPLSQGVHEGVHELEIGCSAECEELTARPQWREPNIDRDQLPG
jgi:hypothetical protein